MKRILASSLMTCLTLAGPALAGERCDFGLNEVAGAEIVVRYPRPHPGGEETDRHDNRHIIFKATPTTIVMGATLGHEDPRIIAVGDFSADDNAGCELLWEERDPADPHQPPEHPQVRVAITNGFLQASSQHFALGTPRPPLPWDVAGAFDLTGDQRADVLWWNPETGALKLWARTQNGWHESEVEGALPPANPTAPAEPSARPPYTAIARLVPDEAPGIVWQDPVNGGPVLYYPTKWNGEQLILEEARLIQGLPSPGLSIAAVSDFDGDGQDDHLMERRTSDNLILICPMNGLVADSPCYRLPPDLIQSESGILGWFVVGPR